VHVRVVLVFLLASSKAFAGWFGPDNYAECMSDALDGKRGLALRYAKQGAEKECYEDHCEGKGRCVADIEETVRCNQIIRNDKLQRSVYEASKARCKEIASYIETECSPFGFQKIFIDKTKYKFARTFDYVHKADSENLIPKCNEKSNAFDRVCIEPEFSWDAYGCELKMFDFIYTDSTCPSSERLRESAGCYLR
jgi:hypothetical protein